MTETLWLETALTPEGWADHVRLEHDGGTITAVERGVAPGGCERVAVAIPGVANVHSHAFQRGMAGLAETRGPAADDFWSWREVMYRFLDRLDPDDVEAVAAQAFAEMLEGGFTRVGEFHYLHHAPDGRPYDDGGELAGRIVAAAGLTGIGLTMLPVFYAHATFGGCPPARGQRRFVTGVAQFGRLVDATAQACASLPDAALGVAPHSLRAVTPDELADITALAGTGPIHIHAAEQVREVQDCLAWCGQRPVAWLLDHAGVDRRWCLVHATHMDGAETRALAATGAVAGLCPVTEANLGDGIFPAAAYLAAGGAFAFGTDSNVLIGAADEMRALEYGQRLANRARNVLAGGDGASVGGKVFRAALAGGAQALGVKVAGLAVGAPLDLVGLDRNHPSLACRRGDALLDGWIFAGRGGAIDSVWRRGCKVVHAGRHVQSNAITARYRRTLRKLLAA